jgi:xylan 1,4-beta-xylosidase
MRRPIQDLPMVPVSVQADAPIGPLETWRHSLGYGGIDPAPLSPAAVAAAAALQPRLVRVFIQEFFQVCRGPDTYDWSRLDPYLDSFAATGANVVAAICIKPPALYSEIDATRWQPSDPGAWQRLIRALVIRYSLERPIVTHWEIGNEPDIGEGGGCPYLIRDANDYLAYYHLTAAPIRAVFPDARIGGPANARLFNPPLPDLALAWRSGADLPLDFVSYHLYSSLPALHGDHVRAAREMFRHPDQPTPELMVTEFSPWFEPTSTPEQAFAGQRAACIAAAVLEMLDAGLDYSFHYHLQDQVLVPRHFEPFFSPTGLRNFVRHFNERPHRFGLLGLHGEPHPQYFVYWMLQRLGTTRLRTQSYDRVGVRALAGQAGGAVNVMLINHEPGGGVDRVASLNLAGLQPGTKTWTVWRVDDERRGAGAPPTLDPVESRTVWAPAEFESHVYLPGGSVALVRLADEAAPPTND